MSKDLKRSVPLGFLHFFGGATDAAARADTSRSSPDQVERALRAIHSVSLIGLVIVVIYGATASASGHSLRGVSIAVLSAGAAFAVGGLLGFLFGMPRRLEGAVFVPSPPQSNRADGTPGAPSSARVIPPGSSLGNTTQDTNTIRPNTSLERISEWLTTLIVGLGIANFREVFERWNEMSIWLTSAIASANTSTLPMNGTPGAVLLFFYGIAGFIAIYLWAVRYLERELALAEHEAEMHDLWTEVKDTRDVADRANKLAQASALFGQKAYEQAAAAFKEVLEVDQTNAAARMGLAVSKSYLPAPGPDEAMEILNELISKNAKNALAHYNKACILAAVKQASSAQIIASLEEAINLDAEYRTRAQQDVDFQGLREDAQFKHLVTP